MKDNSSSKEDIGYTALGGLSAHTLANAGSLYADGVRMTGKHRSVLDELASGPMSTLRKAEHLADYADLAGQGSRRRLFGIPASRLLEGAVPFVQSPAREVFSHHQNSLGLGGHASEDVKNMIDHYRGFGKAPALTLMREIFGDGATAEKMTPNRTMAAGTRKTLGAVLRGEAPVDLKGFVAGNLKNRQVAKQVGDSFENLYTNYQKASKPVSAASAMTRGLGRYGGTAKPVAAVSGLLAALGLGASIKHLTGRLKGDE